MPDVLALLQKEFTWVFHYGDRARFILDCCSILPETDPGRWRYFSGNFPKPQAD
jgi:hypothetical protein